MDRQIDIKSFIIGILVTVCIVLAMGAARSMVSGTNGRFEIVVRDNHAYVLDTADGRVWENWAPSNQGRSSKYFKSVKISPDSTDQD